MYACIYVKNIKCSHKKSYSLWLSGRRYGIVSSCSREHNGL